MKKAITLANNEYRQTIAKRSDRLINYFLAGFFLTGMALAPFYNTWTIALGIGLINLLAFYSAKILLPSSDLYQYVLSVVLGIFMAQFIYQMHGLFEMHFFAFIASAILITYQKWTLQIPLMVFVILHHAGLGYLQNIGYDKIYFTQLDTLSLRAFIIHIILTAVIFYTCGLWAYLLKKNGDLQIRQSVENAWLRQETLRLKERKQNMEALEIAFEKAEAARQVAEQANQAKNIFLATMSHEIRTPLNGVIGMASLLSNSVLTADQSAYTLSITKSGERLLNVINDILDFSKIESGQIDLEVANFDLALCIKEVLDSFRSKAGQQGIELKCRVATAVPSQLLGDAHRLRQVLIHLTGNAVKFTAKGAVLLQVSLVADKGNGDLAILFCVEDSGIGIPADKLQKLFQPFSQLDGSSSRKYGGTGLGLVIAEKLVKVLGGTLHVDSEPGKGSTFSFTIPLKAAASQYKHAAGCRLPQQEVQQLRHNTGSAHQAGVCAQNNALPPDFCQRHPLQILVAEDNPINQQVILHILTKMGYTPCLVENGLYAVEKIKSGDFDLVFMDMQMPEMDGLEATRCIRLQQQKQPVIIAVTANTLDGDQQTCLDAGMDDYISKPLVLEQLVSKIEHWSLQRRRYQKPTG